MIEETVMKEEPSNGKSVEERRKIRGFFQVQITEDDEVVGYSGKMPNNVADEGLDRYILQLMSADAGSLRVSFVALGTGTTINDTATGLPGELGHFASGRAAATLITSANSRLRVTATFDSTQSFVTNTADISNIGLFQQSNTDSGTIFAGNTYASSKVQTNQNVNITYDIDFTG